jgi:hypothetical protein
VNSSGSEMPLAKWKFCRDRVDFEDHLTGREVQALIADKDLRVLQCLSPIDSQTWERLNDQFFTRRPEVTLRVYGFYSLVCDLAFTATMTNVHHFSADCLMDATGIEHTAAMEKLESLGVGIYHLEGFGFLDQVTPRLKKLFLGRTRSSKPDLLPLSRFDALEEVYIEGQQKNIEVLSQLDRLQDVTLRSIGTPDISYLRPLHRMWSLDIKLGGIRDLYAIEGMETIKYLELWQIRGLSDIDVISSLTGLQFLALQSLRRITALPSLNRLWKLRRVYLENMKGLEDISRLEHAPALEEFAHVSAQNMQPEDYIPLLRNPSLKRAAVGFGSDRRNSQFNELMREHSIEPHRFEEFEFV